MVIIKCILIMALAVIFYQDIKARMVAVLLFPAVAALFGLLHYTQIAGVPFFSAVLTNLIFISVLLVILFLYAKLKLKTPFINESMGWGDVLLFYALCFSFPTPAFVIMFVFSVVFSLAIHLIFKSRQQHKTVPLAGYMALFFAALLVVTTFFEPSSLYTLYP